MMETRRADLLSGLLRRVERLRGLDDKVDNVLNKIEVTTTRLERAGDKRPARSQDGQGKRRRNACRQTPIRIANEFAWKMENNNEIYRRPHRRHRSQSSTRLRSPRAVTHRPHHHHRKPRDQQRYLFRTHQQCHEPRKQCRTNPLYHAFRETSRRDKRRKRPRLRGKPTNRRRRESERLIAFERS